MRFFIMALFLLASVHAGHAGMTLSLEEAEKFFIENNPDVRAKRAEIGKADAEIIEAKALPNPSLRYELESLKDGERETEQTFSVSQSLDIFRKRSKKREAAEKRREAGALLLEHDVTEMTVQMKQTYCRILLLKENESAVGELITMFEEVERRTAERVKEGDASEADLMRLSSERKRLVRSLKGLQTEMSVEKKKLALLLNMGQDEFDLPGPLSFSPLSLSARDLADRAVMLRPDIKARSAAVEASGVALSLAALQPAPSPEVEAGYKTRSGGFAGFVFGISIPLPLFDRNQGGIARAETELAQERATLERLKRSAAYEVSVLSERLALLQSRIDDLSQQLETARELVRIAGIAYEEGETGLLELLDATRSGKELTMEYNNAVYEYRATLFDLEKATGTRLVKSGGAQ